MYAYIRGIVEDITEDSVVLDVHDVGYNIKISSYTASRLPAAGECVKLYTYTCVREDAFLLYGFLSKAELSLFKMLITVNGIGPKGGLSILSVMDAADLQYAIFSGDTKLIAKAPGIGPKTAQRVILDLKDKISHEDMLPTLSDDTAGMGISVAADTEQKREAIEALVSLGYGQAESTKAVNAIVGIETMDSSAILKAALKKMF